MSERTVKIIEEHKQNADRTEKEIFGIFGVINTIKITNGKSQWGSLLWFSLEIESFSFFLLFFFPLFCFVVLHTQSSFLEAASVKGFSLFAVMIFFFNVFFSSLRREAPKSRLVTQGLGSCSLNAHARVEQSLLVHQLCSVVLTANRL